MKKSVIGSVIILVYVNLVPYVSRIWRGVEWVAQYLPDEDHRLSGLLFFGGFASLPAISLMVAFLLRKRIPVTLSVSIIVATAMLAYWHYDYDLRSDAQAAIGLTRAFPERLAGHERHRFQGLRTIGPVEIALGVSVMMEAVVARGLFVGHSARHLVNPRDPVEHDRVIALLRPDDRITRLCELIQQRLEPILRQKALYLHGDSLWGYDHRIIRYGRAGHPPFELDVGKPRL